MKQNVAAILMKWKVESLLQVNFWSSIIQVTIIYTLHKSKISFNRNQQTKSGL